MGYGAIFLLLLVFHSNFNVRLLRICTYTNDDNTFRDEKRAERAT